MSINGCVYEILFFVLMPLDTATSEGSLACRLTVCNLSFANEVISKKDIAVIIAFSRMQTDVYNHVHLQCSKSLHAHCNVMNEKSMNLQERLDRKHLSLTGYVVHVARINNSTT